MAIIEARALRKSFGTTAALDGVDLRVEEGRILGLIGPNGAGKTTLLNSILGLTECEGELGVLGRDPWRERDALMRDVCFIADVAVLPRWLRVRQALDYVAGYTVANELSARDLGRRNQLPDSTPFKWDWVGQKCFDDACPIGPWIVPASDIKDPQKLGIKLWVNDVIKQDSNTSDMIFNLAEQLSHLSSRITLYPGDIILTGTPAGVGAARREFLKAGDTTRVWVENVGELVNTMA